MWKMIKLAIFFCILFGVIFTFHWHIGFVHDLPLGILPGDVSFQIGDARVYFPFTTSIVLSIVFRFFIEVVFKRR